MWTLLLVLTAFSMPPALPRQATPQQPPTTGAGVQAPEKAEPAKQEPAKQEPAKQEPEKKEEPKPDEAKPEEAAAKPVRLSPVVIELGFSDWNLSGNAHKFRQFGTPPRGFFVRELLIAPQVSHRDAGYLSMRSPFETDYRLDGRLALSHGCTQIEGWLWHSKFFDPTPTIVPDNDRDVQEESIKQLLSRDASISFRYRMIGQDEYFEAPRLPFHQRTRYWDTIVAGRLGNGFLKLGYTDWRYFDRTGTLFNTTVNGIRLGYMWEPSAFTSVEGTYARLDVKQPAQPTGRVEVVSLSGETAVGPNTDVAVLLRRDQLSLPVIRTAYAREQRLGSLGVAHSWGRWNLRLALSRRDMERVRGDQTFVDVPEFVKFDGRLYGRIFRDVRLTLRGYTEGISHIPPMVTTDPRSLYWNSRNFAQLKLERGTQDLSSYFLWTYRNWDNDARAVHLDFSSFVLGGTWQATPTVSLFAEYTKENWDGTSEITTFPTLRNFLPDSHVITAGVNWVVNPRTFFSLNVSSFGTSNDNPLLLRDGNTDGIFFTLNTRYAFPNGNEIGLIVAPWSYNDDVINTMDYHSTVVMLTGRVKF